MTLRLYNTLARAKQDFTPADPERVTMYVCGPTVYNYAHIGNGRPAIVFDLLFRLLRRRYGEDAVVYARNITDIDDKIMDQATAEGVGIDVISARYTEIYHQDMASLGVLPPTIEPRATEHLGEMRAMIAELIEKGHAYEAEGHVLFHVPSMADYGQLSRHSPDELEAGARVEVAPYKKSPTDFVLWKPSTDDQPGWESPWGRGRPGWHLECSCMIEKHLGETIDIHGGGQDLIFPHHENEIAQSQCAHGTLFVRHWVHNGYVTVDREKMSKSLGNVATIHELARQFPGEALRLTLLTAHYRQPLDFSTELVKEQKRRLDRWYRLTEGVEPGEVPGSVVTALEDDLNTPKALAELEALSSPAALRAGLELMGLRSMSAEQWFQGQGADDDLSADKIEGLIAERITARNSRDFAAADKIRDDLKARGIVLEDGPGGTTWRRAG
ncbi:MAG: cysteine--tRNA ligase [Sphingomonadales bacterium]|nr:cysteine--tRNA ligase [Sphingomonadales bacterium]